MVTYNLKYYYHYHPSRLYILYLHIIILYIYYVQALNVLFKKNNCYYTLYTNKK